MTVWLLSPLGRAHFCDDIGAVCGKFNPEPWERFPATDDTPRCPQCKLLSRPTTDTDKLKEAAYRATWRERQRLLAQGITPPPTVKSPAKRALTERQRIVALAASGELSHQAIAERLAISIRRVREVVYQERDKAKKAAERKSKEEPGPSLAVVAHRIGVSAGRLKYLFETADCHLCGCERSDGDGR